MAWWVHVQSFSTVFANSQIIFFSARVVMLEVVVLEVVMSEVVCSYQMFQ